MDDSILLLTNRKERKERRGLIQTHEYYSVGFPSGTNKHSRNFRSKMKVGFSVETLLDCLVSNVVVPVYEC